MTQEVKDKLKYGSELHQKFLTAILDRWRLSNEQMTKFYDAFDTAENSFRMYLPARTEDKKRQSQRKVSGVVQYTDIVIPYSYAILMAAHMYWSQVFLGRDPVFQFQSQSGETEEGAMALETLFDYQLRVGKMMVPFSIWLLGLGKYGLSVLGHYWDEKWSNIVNYVDVPSLTPEGTPDPNRAPKKEKQVQRMMSYAGNRVFNVRPRDFFPDPRLPLVRFQEGEFCGHIAVVGWNKIVSNPEFFNLDNIPPGETTYSWPERSSSIGEPPLTSTRSVQMGRNAVALLEMTIDLIPEMWGIGPETQPQKWAFTVANRTAIIGAEPLGALHNEFPYDIQMYEVEGHDFLGKGMMELLKPLNDGMDWLFNTHIYNVRKSLNDNFLVDPSRITMSDFEGGPGRIIRLKPSAYGTPLDSVFKQLQVMDITRSNINDLQTIADFMQRLTGVVDSIMGMLDPGGRKTATEVRNAGGFSVNRLKVNAEYNSTLGWMPLAEKMLSNTQQYMEAPVRWKIGGNFGKTNYMEIKPEDIAGAFFYVPADGTLPIDRQGQAQSWNELFQSIGKFGPMGMQILQSYDMGGIFAWVAQLMGLKNIERFKIQQQPGAPPMGMNPVAMPDNQVAQNVQAGNLIPIPGNGAMPQ